MLTVNFPILKQFSNGNHILFHYDSAPEGHNPRIDFEENYLYCIRGENGLGKTTFINILGLLSDFNGKYYVNGNQYIVNGQYDFNFKDVIRKKNLSYIFQDPHIINTYTIDENLRIVNQSFYLQNEIEKIIARLDYRDESRINYLKKKLYYLKDYLNDSPYYLSGGEKQLLAFIRAMIKPARILLADEPWANMDIILKEFVEHQLFLYTRNKDAFNEYRNSDSSSNIVLVITHTNQLDMNYEVCQRDMEWQASINVLMKLKDKSILKSNILSLDRYEYLSRAV